MIGEGRLELGPGRASLLVRTYREGVAARAGHDLVLEVTRWSATAERGEIALDADPRSLEVREGVGGVKPLTDRDRAEIRRTIDRQVLRGEPIAFRGRADGRAVSGELTMAGVTRPVSFALTAGEGGRVSGTIPLTQSQWGIRPYRGFMGALKVRDDVEVVFEALVDA